MKVSVAMITYNQERFVAQAIESTLAQETGFDYEIVIGEDCSTDDTRGIVVEFHQRYPDRVRLLLHERNVGMIENFVQTLQACRGEYIALLEGDDYWISPHKLQMQVEFLDSHPECAICFHSVAEVRDGEGQGWREYCPKNQKVLSTLEDLLLSCSMRTSSVMYRRGLFGEFPDWYFSMEMGDYPLFILNAQHGKVGYINETMSVYRVHPGGIWSAKSPERWLRAMFHMYSAVNAHLDFKYDHVVARAKAGYLSLFLVEQVKTANSMEEGIALALQTLEQWADLDILDGWKTRAMGRVYAYYIFSGYADRDFPAVRQCFAKLLRYDPSWLRNVGVLSILAEAFLGRIAASLLRRLARKTLRFHPTGVDGR